MAQALTGAPRQRRRVRPVDVVAVTTVAPRLIQVSLAGDALSDFELSGPTRHVKLFLPSPGQDAPVLPEFGDNGPVWPDGAERPIVRTYTPRRFDPATGVLDIQFVLHGTGPAAQWAAGAAVGDRVAVAGPGGQFSLPLGAPHWLIAGDESAIPAIATLLEALPPGASGDVVIEVGDTDDQVQLPVTDLSISWRARARPDAWGDELERAVATLDRPDGTQVWVACEATAVRRIRRHLIDGGHPLASLTTRGYWRHGVANHPDHDHGDDE